MSYQRSPAGRLVHLPGSYTPTRRPRTLDERVTPHRRRILALVAEGLTDRAIGRRLGISTASVSEHLRHARAALGARDRTHAVVLAYRAGLLDLDHPATSASGATVSAAARAATSRAGVTR